MSTASNCLGKVVKSNSHCDYVVQIDTPIDVENPPDVEDYGFGQFVKFGSRRHWAVGIVYNSQLMNPAFSSSGPRLTTAPDPLFTPDLIQDTSVLLNVVLVGTLQAAQPHTYGKHGIPRIVIPANTAVSCMGSDEIYHFHLNAQGEPQFAYYGHLLRSGGSFAAELTQQVLADLIAADLFSGADQRALAILKRELAWKSTLGSMR